MNSAEFRGSAAVPPEIQSLSEEIQREGKETEPVTAEQAAEKLFSAPRNR